MAKNVKKAVAADAKKPKGAAASVNVSGTGFKKTYSQSQLQEIQTKRREMRSRLFAAG